MGMKGVKAMLAAAAGEMDELEKANEKPAKAKKEAPKKAEAKIEEVMPEPVEDDVTVEPVATTEKTAKPKPAKKAKVSPGRPTNKEKGITPRKQFTITLREDDYEYFQNMAKSKYISLAKLIENALYAYDGKKPIE